LLEHGEPTKTSAIIIENLRCSQERPAVSWGLQIAVFSWQINPLGTNEVQWVCWARIGWLSQGEGTLNKGTTEMDSPLSTKSWL
jgi:hypothetical protein